MTLRIGIQMDALSTLDIGGDTTLFLCYEAARRGHGIFAFTPDSLALEAPLLRAKGHDLAFDGACSRPVAGPTTSRVLNDFDVVMVRQDPPFDMAYITSTYLLEHLQPDVFVTNDPGAIRSNPEKLLPTFFPDLVPPTLITRDANEIDAFRRHHGDIIVKPLYGAGGSGVFHIKPGDTSLNALIELMGRRDREPFAVQRYIPEITEGDKRILLIEGKPVGAVLRMAAAGESRANLHAGGTAHATNLTERDLEICGRIGPFLSEMGLLFAGIDVIGDYLVEINVTSPGMITDYFEVSGHDISPLFWDAVEARVHMPS